MKREGKPAGGDTGDPVRTPELRERRHCSPVEDVSGVPALMVSPSDQPRAFSEPKLVLVKSSPRCGRSLPLE